MQMEDAVEPHEGLQVAHAPTRLRPLGRRPVLLQRYCCRICSTNWLLERDPLDPERPEWVCLYQASSILDPVSAVHQVTRSTILSSSTGRTDAAYNASPEQLRHSLI
jgi:hypothetical protein